MNYIENTNTLQGILTHKCNAKWEFGRTFSGLVTAELLAGREPVKLREPCFAHLQQSVRCSLLTVTMNKPQMFSVPSARRTTPGPQATSHFAGVTCHLPCVWARKDLKSKLQSSPPMSKKPILLQGRLSVSIPAPHGTGCPAKPWPNESYNLGIKGRGGLKDSRRSQRPTHLIRNREKMMPRKGDTACKDPTVS